MDQQFEPKTVSLIGASGYTGTNLHQLLHAHPRVKYLDVVAHNHAGQAITQALPYWHHPNSQPTHFSTVDQALSRIKNNDLLFLCLPHGQTESILSQLPSKLPVIDLAGDFRLADPRLRQQWYGTAAAADYQFDYAIPECHPPTDGPYFANAGCFATAVQLGLAPLVQQAWLSQHTVIADCKTGSSGSGKSPSEKTHHPQRAASFSAYKPFAHQHTPEIQQGLKQINRHWQGDLLLQVHSAPMVRGIYATLYAQLTHSRSPQQLANLFSSYYHGSDFIRLTTPALPDVHHVTGSNYADIGWACQDKQLIVYVALDNLLKGAAGSALQLMNRYFDWPQTTGLHWMHCYP